MKQLKDVMEFKFEERDAVRKGNMKVAVENFNAAVGTNAEYEDGTVVFYDQDVIKLEKLFGLEYIYIPFAHNKDVPYYPGRPETYEVVNSRTAASQDRVQFGYYHANESYNEDRGILELHTMGFVLLYLSVFTDECEIVDDYSFAFNGMQYPMLKSLKKLQKTYTS